MSEVRIWSICKVAYIRTSLLAQSTVCMYNVYIYIVTSKLQFIIFGIPPPIYDIDKTTNYLLVNYTTRSCFFVVH